MLSLWTLTDGKAGDLVQCLGVAEAVADLAGGGAIGQKTVRPRRFFAWWAPRGPADPRDLAALNGPQPDIVIASGRRTVPVLRALKRRWPDTFTVFLKDPRTGAGAADLIWVPEHDRLRGDNVLVTLTSPHRLQPARRAAAIPRPQMLALPRPRVAVMVGGASRHARFGPGDVEAFAAGLESLIEAGAGLMITPSRRTPPALTQRLRALPEQSVFLWDGTGDNPLPAMLNLADAVVVTGDSVNMAGEAATTGKAVHVFVPEGLSGKVMQYVDALVQRGVAVKFAGHLEKRDYAPLDSTPLIAQEILQRFRRQPER